MLTWCNFGVIITFLALYPACSLKSSPSPNQGDLPEPQVRKVGDAPDGKESKSPKSNCPINQTSPVNLFSYRTKIFQALVRQDPTMVKPEPDKQYGELWADIPFCGVVSCSISTFFWNQSKKDSPPGLQVYQIVAATNKHAYVMLFDPLDPDNPLIIDGTYLQYLNLRASPTDSSKLPKVFIGSIDELIRFYSDPETKEMPTELKQAYKLHEQVNLFKAYLASGCQPYSYEKFRESVIPIFIDFDLKKAKKDTILHYVYTRQRFGWFSPIDLQFILEGKVEVLDYQVPSPQGLFEQELRE